MSIKSFFIRTPYNYDTDEVSEGTGIVCVEPSLTQQSSDGQSMEEIIDRYLKTNLLPQADKMPSFGDFTNAVDFRTSMDVIRRANDAFMTLDPKLRLRFGNDPHQFMEYLHDESNLDEARKLGLIAPLPVKQDVEVPPVPVV